MKNNTLHVLGLDIRMEAYEKEDYISLTDIAKHSNDKPANLIANWMKNSSTLLFLSTWGKLHIPDFNALQIQTFSSTNSFL